MACIYDDDNIFTKDISDFNGDLQVIWIRNLGSEMVEHGDVARCVVRHNVHHYSSSSIDVFNGQSNDACKIYSSLSMILALMPEIWKRSMKIGDAFYIVGDPEVTANLYSNFAYSYWEGCVIWSIYLRLLMGHPVYWQYNRENWVAWFGAVFQSPGYCMSRK